MKKISSEIYQNFYRKNLVKIKNKKKIALIFENKKISYHTLLLNSDIVAFNLSKEKKFLKSTIIVSLENSEKYVYLLLAASKLNVSLLLINPDSTEVQIQKIKKKCKLVITDKKKLNNFDKNKFIKLKILSIQDLLQKSESITKKTVTFKKKNYIVNFTSGSTGVPKNIIYTQSKKIDRANQLKDNFLDTQNNIFINYAPIYHSLGQRLIFSSLLNSNLLILMRKFNFYEWEKNVEKYKVTILFPISSHLDLLVHSMIKNQHKYKSVKKIIASSSQISVKTKNLILKKFKNIFYEAYGAAEVAFVSVLSPNDNNSKSTSVGKIVNNVKILILKSPSLNNKNYGEICCKSKFLSKFSNKEKKNKSIFYRKQYFRTGDLGRLDSDGYLYFASRIKDIIIKSGVNIVPKDIEDVILETKKVKSCVVIGVKDEIFGETPIAICEVKADKKKEESQLEVNLFKKLSKHQIPSKVIYTKKLKFLSTGKVDKMFYKKKYSNLIINKGKSKLFIS